MFPLSSKEVSRVLGTKPSRAKVMIKEDCTRTEQLRVPVAADSQTVAVAHFCKQKWKTLPPIKVEVTILSHLVVDISTHNAHNL